MFLKFENGYINGLPFNGLQKKSDLFSFEFSPVLSHYLDASNNDYLFYWIDFEDDNNRWLCIRLSKESLYYYLNDGISLRELTLDKKYNPYLFIVNQEKNGDFTSGYLKTIEEIPSDYLP